MDRGQIRQISLPVTAVWQIASRYHGSLLNVLSNALRPQPDYAAHRRSQEPASMC